MANIINIHFATVGAELVANIENVQQDYKNNIFLPTFSLHGVSCEDVQELMLVLAPPKLVVKMEFLLVFCVTQETAS